MFRGLGPSLGHEPPNLTESLRANFGSMSVLPPFSHLWDTEHGFRGCEVFVSGWIAAEFWVR